MPCLLSICHLGADNQYKSIIFHNRYCYRVRPVHFIPFNEVLKLIWERKDTSNKHPSKDSQRNVCHSHRLQSTAMKQYSPGLHIKCLIRVYQRRVFLFLRYYFLQRLDINQTCITQGQAKDFGLFLLTEDRRWQKVLFSDCKCCLRWFLTSESNTW